MYRSIGGLSLSSVPLRTLLMASCVHIWLQGRGRDAQAEHVSCLRVSSWDGVTNSIRASMGVALTRVGRRCRCPGCGRLAHDECWAPHLRMSADGHALPQSTVLPERGSCPACSHELTWLQVITEDMSVQPPGRRGRGRRAAKKRKPRKAKAAARDASATAGATEGEARAAHASSRADAMGTTRKPAKPARQPRKAASKKAAPAEAAVDASQPSARAPRATRGKRAAAAAARTTQAAQRRAAGVPGAAGVTASEAESAVARSVAAETAFENRQRVAAQRLWAWGPDGAQHAPQAAGAREGSETAMGGSTGRVGGVRMHSSHAFGEENIDRNVSDSQLEASIGKGGQAVIDVSLVASRCSDRGGSGSGDGGVMLSKPLDDARCGVQLDAAMHMTSLETAAGSPLRGSSSVGANGPSIWQHDSPLGSAQPVAVWQALASLPNEETACGATDIGDGRPSGVYGGEAVACGSPRAALALCDELPIGDGMPALAVGAGGETFLLRGTGSGGAGSSGGRGGPAGVLPGGHGSPAGAAGGAGGALIAGNRRCSPAAGQRAPPPHAHNAAAAGPSCHTPQAQPIERSQNLGNVAIPECADVASGASWWPMPSPGSPWHRASDVSSLGDATEAAPCPWEPPGSPAWHSAAPSPRYSPVATDRRPGGVHAAATAPAHASALPGCDASHAPVFHSTHASPPAHASVHSPSLPSRRLPGSPAATPAIDDGTADEDTCMQNTTPAAAAPQPRRRCHPQLLPLFAPDSSLGRDARTDGHTQCTPSAIRMDEGGTAATRSRLRSCSPPGRGCNGGHMHASGSPPEGRAIPHALCGAAGDAWGCGQAPALRGAPVSAWQGGLAGNMDTVSPHACNHWVHGADEADDVEMVTPEGRPHSPMVIDLMS